MGICHKIILNIVQSNLLLILLVNMVKFTSDIVIDSGYCLQTFLLSYFEQLRKINF